MMLSCNRFAFIPRLCLECKRYIWLEGSLKLDGDTILMRERLLERRSDI